MALLPAISYPATICTIAAYYFIGGKTDFVRKFGFFVGVLGNFIWIAYAISPLQIGLIVTNGAILVLGVRGYINNATKKEEQDIELAEQIEYIKSKHTKI